jgi:octaprenyl-diphosphate synthase
MLTAETRTGGQPTSFPQASLAWTLIVEGVEPFLASVSERLSAQVQEFEPEIAQYARYALTAQGKQLRPMLVALSANAAGKVNEQHVTVAAIIEMVHLATLVHDDIIDQAKIRRGRPTLTAECGSEISVLLGDCLYAQAVKLAASFPTPEICRVVSDATNRVCSGEILQRQQQGNFQMSQAEYFRIVAMKTGELFALSCYLGGLLSQASPAQREALRQYGLALGTAYQIYDDCMDLFGTEKSAGKSLGTDLAKGKLTLPLLIALERAEVAEKNELQELIQGWKSDSLPRVLQVLDKYDAFSESRAIISQYLATARQNLLVLSATPGRAALANLTEFLAQQVEALESSSSSC